jgi:hypothetical protein
MAADKRRRRGAHKNRPLVLAALAAFVIVDVGLVALALTGANHDVDSDAAPLVPTASSAASPEDEPTPQPTDPDEDLIAPTWFLSAVDATTAYRASAGACPATTPPVLQKSTDSGSTWVSAAVTTDLASVFRVQAVDSTYAYLVGLGGESCEPGLTATYTSGVGFQTYPDRVESTWYLDPQDLTSVQSPAGQMDVPCVDPVSIAPTDDNAAALLCADRSVFRTIDSGSTWDAGSEVPGAAALASTGTSYVLAAQGVEGCTGVSIIGLGTDGDEPVAVGCSGDRPVASAPNQELTLSAAAGTVWLAIGESAAVSLDGGVTW